ncbi:MAG: APC family permease [Candidatus Acidiferrales bacterium]
MPTLERTLNLRDLILLIVGSVIGSGIFLVPGAILRQVNGSVGLAVAVWVCGGLLSLLGALTYGELSAMNPAAGGLYVYIREGFGRLPAFLYGLTLFLAIATGSIATLAAAFSAYMSQIIPLSPLGIKAVAVGMIVVVTAVNVWGTRESADMQNWTTLIKVAAILVMSVILLALGRGYSSTLHSLWPAQHRGIAASFGIAMIAVLWAYEGWQFASYSAGEARNPQRDFPRAFFAGTVFLMAIYLIAVVAYLAALGPEKVAASDTIAATAIDAVLGAGFAKLVALMILVSTFSAANSIQLTAPRVFYAMAMDGLFFKRLAEIHSRFRTPAIAVLACGAWSAVLVCLGSFQQLFTYVIFTGWIFYGLAAASIFQYRRRMPEAVRPYRVPGYPWTPALFVIAAAALVLNTIFSGPTGAAEGLGIVLLGLPAYLIWRRRGKPVAE